MKKTSTVMSVIFRVIVVILIIGVVGMVFAFMNNGQKNFYVRYGNENISYKTENKELQKNAYNVFYCKNVLAVSNEMSKADNFTVTIMANEKALSGCDFSSMKMDGIPTNSFFATDVTVAFDITIGNGYFTLYLPETLTAETVLNKVYPEVEITGIPEINLYEKDYFSILVYSEQEKSTVTIGFH